MKFTVSLLIALLSVPTCLAQLWGDSEVVKEDRQVDGSFDGIIAKGSVNVFVSFGSKASVRVEVDEDYKDQLITEVRGKDLHVYTEGRIWNPKKLDVYVVATSLKLLEASGATDVSIDDEWKGEQVRIYLSGSSDLEVRKGLICREVKLEASASSDADIYLEATNAIFTLSGSSDLEIKGRANLADIQCQGSSDLDGKDFMTRKCKIDASGSSDVRIAVADELEVDASGSSDVYYDGEPAIHFQKSTGSSSVSRM